MPKRRLVVRNKARAAGRLSLLLFALLVIIGAVIASVFAFRSCSRVSSRRSLSFTSQTPYTYTGSGLLYIEANKLNYQSLIDDDDNFSVSMNTASAKPFGSDGIKGVYNSRAFRILNTEFDVEVAGELIRACCGNKYIAVFVRAEDGTCSLRAYDTTGSMIYRVDYDRTTLLDFGFNSLDGSLLWTAELSTKSGTPSTTITTFDLSRLSTTGIMSIQGQTARKVWFSGKSIFVSCTDNLVRFDLSVCREKYRLLTYGCDVSDASMTSSGAVFLLRDGVSANAVRLLRVKEGDVPEAVSRVRLLPENTVDCFVMNGRLVIVTDSELLVRDFSGELVESLTLSPGVTGAAKLSESRIIVENGSELTLITLK